MPPVISFPLWQAIVRYDDKNNPRWFSYFILSHIECSLSVQMAADLTNHFSKEIQVYDLYGSNGEGTARIKIIF